MVEKKKAETKLSDAKNAEVLPEVPPEPEPVNGLVSSEGGIIYSQSDMYLKNLYPDTP